jgi:hypothetical protein
VGVSAGDPFCVVIDGNAYFESVTGSDTNDRIYDENEVESPTKTADDDALEVADRSDLLLGGLSDDSFDEGVGTCHPFPTKPN